jgi:hypothetical protein
VDLSSCLYFLGCHYSNAMNLSQFNVRMYILDAPMVTLIHARGYTNAEMARTMGTRRFRVWIKSASISQSMIATRDELRTRKERDMAFNRDD